MTTLTFGSINNIPQGSVIVSASTTDKVGSNQAVVLTQLPKNVNMSNSDYNEMVRGNLSPVVRRLEAKQPEMKIVFLQVSYTSVDNFTLFKTLRNFSVYGVLVNRS